MGRWRRTKPHVPAEASRVDALEAELEAERLRQTLTQRRASATSLSCETRSSALARRRARRT